MPIGTTLLAARTQLRSEIGASSDTNQAASTINVWNNLLDRVQKRLYADFNWPHLFIDEDFVLTAGSRYSTFVVSAATAGMNWDRVLTVWLSFNSIWREIRYGITATDYNISNSIGGIRLDPIQKW